MVAVVAAEREVAGDAAAAEAVMAAAVAAAVTAVVVVPAAVLEVVEAAVDVDTGLVESPFQHTCLKHLQDCVVNGD